MQRILIFCFLLIIPGLIIRTYGLENSSSNHKEGVYFNGSGNKTTIREPSRLEYLNQSFHKSILDGDTAKSRLILNSILSTIKNNKSDSLIISDSYYYAGVFYLMTGRNQESSMYFRWSSGIRENLGTHDAVYANSLYNLGVIYNSLGDFSRMEQCTFKSIEVEKKLYGDSNPKLVWGYSSLVAACLGLKDYDRAINFGIIALKLIDKQQDGFYSILTDLYTNIGVCYIKVSDYSKAVLYLEKAEAVYDKYHLVKDERYLNLLNSLAAAFFFLDRNDKSDEYYTKGLKIAESLNTFLSQNFVNSFARVLGSAGKIEKGEALMRSSLNKAEKNYGTDSGIYIYVLTNYADYLREFKIDIRKSLFLYEECTAYLDRHKEDISQKGQILLGYSLSLTENGNPEKALQLIQNLIFSGLSQLPEISATENPDFELIKPDLWSLSLFKAKHKILWEIYKKSGDVGFLVAASATSGLIVSILEKVRINIDEEDSRLVLGDRYRDYYLFAIRDCDLCFKKTGRNEYQEKAFEFSEKSKVAALLTATRELKATQFHIPDDIAELEKHLQLEISFYNAKISEETNAKNSDSLMISEWKTLIFDAIQKRDSLIDMFGKKYPGYFSIKYNTRVIKPRKIREFAGRNTNYISYVAGDTVIYIFISNRRYNHITSVSVDSTFFNNIREFRELLSAPSPLNNAKNDFRTYQRLGTYLYNTIFKPVEQYLISDKLLISPDNLLSYIPFEALPESEAPADKILYKDIPYLIKKYKISYTYSATFLAESSKEGFSTAKNLIAFAPFYNDTIKVESLLSRRQQRFSTLNDLPFARMEAQFVSDFTGGKLCLNSNAKESVYKAEAGKYDIIHLAMHTVLNDQNPMHSKLVFSQVRDSLEDGLLNTYEVYGIPLKAKMVILSSCNTGSGLLHTGEGIISLARGFMYSGSQSVIMSLWEIEDRSGTEIIENFYRNLRKGYNKSRSLRLARLNYLRKADMLKSHPYFWSTLVIYGNNDRLYQSGQLRILAAAGILILFLAVVVFYRKSR